MTEKFNGFSQAEIKKMSGNNNQQAGLTNAATTYKPAFRGPHGVGIRRVPEKPPMSKNFNNNNAKKQQSTNKETDKPIVTTKETEADVSNSHDSLQEMCDEGMSKSIEEALFFQPSKKSAKTEHATHANHLSNYVFANGVNEGRDAKLNDSSILKSPDDIVSSSNDTSSLVLGDSIMEPENGLNLDSPFKGISLKDFETHRKMIEEQNKQKKELLHKAIEQYSLKTAAEARKIEEIKSELSKLDNDLALDVAILRKQIDMACLHFSNMEKQYMKIESQFLKAKLDLHNAAEKKELLTEHLCTVIAHNEDRKAQKLSELMQKVGLTSAGDFEPKEMPTTNMPDK